MSEITIALDVLGGDHAPEEIIKGVREALPEIRANLILVGPIDVIKPAVADLMDGRVTIENAPGTVAMSEKATASARGRPDNTIAVAARLCKEGRAQAMVSAGNTGAVMSTALLSLGRIKGIKRPAIAVVIPTAEKPVVLLDVGANSDCKPEYFVDFAILGSIFCRETLGVANPTVGLINIGEESSKGSDLYQKAHVLLKQAPVDFVGNVESKDIPGAKVDVFVCDGFTGNVILKLLEGMSSALFDQLKQTMMSSLSAKMAAAVLRPSLTDLKKKMDKEEYGGAHLLGINGVCVICHGTSKAKAIKNALKVAEKALENGLVDRITETAGQKIEVFKEIGHE